MLSHQEHSNRFGSETVHNTVINNNKNACTLTVPCSQRYKKNASTETSLHLHRLNLNDIVHCFFHDNSDNSDKMIVLLSVINTID